MEIGSYDKVLKNVGLWLELFLGASTKATLSYDDLPYIRDSVLHLWSLEINNVHMNTVFEDCREEGDYLILKNSCGCWPTKSLRTGIMKNTSAHFSNGAYRNLCCGTEVIQTGVARAK